MRRMAQWEIIGGHAQWELVDACTAERKVPLEKTYLGPIIQWDWQPPCDPMDYKRLDDYAFSKFREWLDAYPAFPRSTRPGFQDWLPGQPEPVDWRDMPKAVFLRAVSVLNVFAIVPG